jgi:hypothetical protein
MPQRTNDFQHLVALIQKALAHKNAGVTESVLFKLGESEEYREIDVVIEDACGPYRITIAVEAKDHKRPLSADQFDAIVGKYRGTDRALVDKVAIVTYHGFTTMVRERAKREGIDLCTLRDAKPPFWQSLANARSGTVRLRMSPHVRWVSCEPEIAGVDVRQLNQNGHVICPHGNDHGALFACGRWLVHQCLTKWKVEEVMALCAQMADVARSDGQAWGVIQAPAPNHKILYMDQYYAVQGLHVHLHTVDKVDAAAIARVNRYELESNASSMCVIDRLQFIGAGTKVDFVIPKDSKRMVVSISNADMKGMCGTTPKRQAGRRKRSRHRGRHDPEE